MRKSLTQTVIDAYAAFFERHRSIVLLFIVAMTLACLYGITRTQFDDDIIKLLVPRESISTEGDVEIGERTDRGLLVMLKADDLFTPESLRVIQETGEQLKELDHVLGVVSLYDLRTPKRVGRRRTFSRVVPPPDADPARLEKARQLVMDHPMAQEQLISADGLKTLMLLEVSPELKTSAQIALLVKEINQVVARTTEGTAVAGVATGVPAIRVEMAHTLVRDQVVFNVAGPLVAILIAYVMFRQAASVFIVLAGAGMGVIWTLGLLGLIGIPINPVNAVIAPLALTIGLTDSVHLLIHFRSDRAQGADRLHAAVAAISTVGFPSALTSLTSAVGFASMGIAELEVLAEFSLCSALAVVVAFVSVMTIVPTLASSWMGKHVELPADAPTTEMPPKTKWHTHLVTFVVDHSVAVLVLSLLATGWAFYVATDLAVDPRIANGLPTSGAPRAAYQSIDGSFGGALPFVVTVRWDDATGVSADEVYNAIADAHAAVAEEPVLGPPVSLENVYQSMAKKDQNPKSLFQFLAKIPQEQLNNIFDREHHQAMVLARCRDAGGAPIRGMLDNLTGKLADLEDAHPGFTFSIPDTAVQGIANSTYVVTDLAKSLLLAVPVTLGVLMLALRSIKAGVIALLPNVFPMVALAATIVLSGQSVTLTGAAVFVMCFGIAVDDTIHTISAFKRYHEAGYSVRDAIIQSYRDLGDAVIATTVILIGGLAVVMLGQSYMTRSFGMAFCIGLFWAVVGDLIILPAVLACWPHKRADAQGHSATPPQPVAATSPSS